MAIVYPAERGRDLVFIEETATASAETGSDTVRSGRFTDVWTAAPEGSKITCAKR